jgi:DNA-binding transcriptional MerR regulator
MKRTRQNMADELGVGIETLRYYEKQGLIQAPERSSNGYRLYTPADALKIKHVLLLKEHGFTLKEIKAFSSFANPTNEEIKRIIQDKIRAISERPKNQQ